ncbi:hypothetical protein, partial [Endozoicomonas sp. SESOKO4]
MNVFRSGLAVALLSAIYGFPCYAFSTVEPTTSSTYTKASSCSELTRRIDRDVCNQHISEFKALIREKNNQISPTTSSSGHSLISETVKIRKIPATNTRPDLEVFKTDDPTLFIFDSEQVPGKGRQAIYELPLAESVDGHDAIVSFQLPDNSAFVGNGRNEVRPEFLIDGRMQNHYVMSAPHNNSVYYLANIEVDSRNPLDTGGISTTLPTGSPHSTPSSRSHMPAGILNLMGAGIFVADNVKVVLDPANNHGMINSVKLGCNDDPETRGGDERFIYRFIRSEFNLLQGTLGETYRHNAALNVECFQETGQVQLTMKNTKTVIKVPNDAPTADVPEIAESSGVLFSFSFQRKRESVLRFVDSTCNRIVDQHDNDLSIDSALPSDPDHYIGGWHHNHCSDFHAIQGAFGLKGIELAWGLKAFDYADSDSCSHGAKKSYRLGFASLYVWSTKGINVACNCTMPTFASSISPTEWITASTETIAPTESAATVSSTVSPYTTQVAYTSPVLIPDPGALVMNSTDTAGLTISEKVGVGLGVLADQVITHSWFYLSKRIRQAWIRHTSQALAATLGLGIPMFQLLTKFVCGVRERQTEHILLS